MQARSQSHLGVPRAQISTGTSNPMISAALFWLFTDQAPSQASGLVGVHRSDRLYCLTLMEAIGLCGF